MSRILIRAVLFFWAIVAFGGPAAHSYWQSRSQVSVGAAGYSGPGDIVSGAKAWWGLRGYNAAYTGNAANICTPLDAVCLDVTINATGGLNTTTLGTLACNNVTTICTVKTIYDQSGSTNCVGPLACDLTQTTIAFRPTYVAPGAANGCPSTALPCMCFNGAASQRFYVNGTPQINSISQPFTYSALVNKTAGSVAVGLTFTDTPFNAIGYRTTANNQIYTYAGTLATATASDGVYHAIQAVFSNTSSDINIDGSVNTVSTGTDGTGGSIGIGWDTGTGYFTGCITEIGIWPSAFSSGQSTSMSANQHSYWGF